MKKIVILGATGSLGIQMLKVLEKYQDRAKVIGISAKRNFNLLRAQAKQYGVENTVLASEGGSVDQLACLPEADIVVNVLPGLAGVPPTLSALNSGKLLLLGNKESLVAEGKSLDTSRIISLDSEHNAIYEIIAANPKEKIKSITIPCSGGPFLNRENLNDVTAEEALNHPKWKMGPKVSLESATLINKGIEILEAHYLFNLPLEQIHAVIHPECQIHGIVEFEDRTLAYYAQPDMKEHLENALCHALEISPPRRDIHLFDPTQFQLTSPPHHRLPGIQIVLDNFQRSPGEMRKFLYKEEQALQKFLDGKIGFQEIFKLLK
jgi:1-deoxy-D-xylulose-5-phosphate reductoisomerase